MSRGATIVVENNFVQGLITEFSAMNFPENAVTDADNVVFSELGRVTRRNGFDIEEGGTVERLSNLANYPKTFAEYKWDSVGSDGSISLLVQQMGEAIRFFEVKDTPLSSSREVFSIGLGSYRTGVTVEEVASQPCQFASGKGYLFIVHPFCDPLYVKYTEDEDSISVKTVNIEVRDFERLIDGLATDTRPATLSDYHHYNLFNQGWYYKAITDLGSSPIEVLSAWSSSGRGDYPSNADVWWVYKNGLEVAYFGKNQKDQYISPTQITVGNTPAANGHYIYTAWDINRSAMTGIPNLPRTSSGIQRPSCVAFYAGRVFYAGISSDHYSDKLYFSQIIDSDDQFGKCYQVNDPTSETIFDLLDSDGGVINLPLISKIVSLQVVGDALIIFGTNGVFAVRGTENGPFRATDYSVEFVSSIGGVSHLSIVNVDNSLIWWNYDAIYALGKDQIGVYFQVENISKTTIQSIVDSVPPHNKLYIKAAYNKRERLVQWLFNDQFDSNPYEYNRILELNAVSKAFYTHTLPLDSPPRLCGIVSISGTRGSVFELNVTDSSLEIVTDSSFNEVTVNSTVAVPNIEQFKYTTIGNISDGEPGFTYSEKTDGYIDWSSVNPKSYSSYFTSGYRIRGEMLRPFNSTPIAVVLDNIEGAETFLKGIWDYGLRESVPQNLYRFQLTGDYIIRRVKIRGKGRSFQLHFESDEDKPFSIVGWSTFDTGGQIP